LRTDECGVHNLFMSSDPVTIVIPAFNQTEVTRQCVASILESTTVPFHINLVDNGSESPLADHIPSGPELTIIRSEENLGFAAGVNLGMANAEGHVLLLNNDTLVPTGWLDPMVGLLRTSPGIGAVGPMSNAVSGSQLIPDLALTSMDEINACADRRRREHAGTIRDVARLVGFCMLIRREAVADVGLFDEQFGTGNFEDDDYCVRLLRAGYRLCVDEGSFVFHYGSQTFQEMGLVGDAWQSLIAENEERFGAKWSLRPEDRLDSFQASLQRNREAATLLSGGDVKGAIAAYVEAIQIEPRLGQNHNDLAVVLWQHREREQAYRRVEQAVKLDSEDEDARANLMDMAAALERTEEARNLLANLSKETKS
jgi:cellulose synthase/poly-beta-1,6-N-acetylglucosamine synthase-like glycosyltransferase